MAIYVAHDHTLIAVLKCLGYPLKEIPFFANHLSMDLYNNRTTNFYYKDKKILPELNNLDQLYKQFDKYQVEDYDKACGK